MSGLRIGRVVTLLECECECVCEWVITKGEGGGAEQLKMR